MARWRSFRDGIAITGAGEEPESLRRHYFDSRGVDRVYEMNLREGVWKQWRDAPDPVPQRFSGTFSDDGRTIAGRWDKAEDDSNREADVDLTYRKVSRGSFARLRALRAEPAAARGQASQ